MKFLLSLYLSVIVGLSVGMAGSGDVDPWLVDLPKALNEARATGKYVFIHFSGSDWCGWCIKLRKDVFSKTEFESYARSNLVLVRIDFPKHKPQPVALQKANLRLAEQFGVRAYPTLVLLDGQGTKVGTVSYGHGGARQFLADIEKVLHPSQDFAPPKAPLRRGSGLHRAAKAGEGGANSTALTLRKITGTKQRRQAVINNQTLSPGESAVVRVATGGQIRVRCLEIREQSVLISVDGEKAHRELRLPAGA